MFCVVGTIDSLSELKKGSQNGTEYLHVNIVKHTNRGNRLIPIVFFGNRANVLNQNAKAGDWILATGSVSGPIAEENPRYVNASLIGKTLISLKDNKDLASGNSASNDNASVKNSTFHDDLNREALDADVSKAVERVASGGSLQVPDKVPNTLNIPNQSENNVTSKKNSESNVTTTPNSDKIADVNNGRDTFSNQKQSQSMNDSNSDSTEFDDIDSKDDDWLF